mmetsp:Transcript_72888/g.204719  ORF Transcript_72888/g.204719 Transcript_72888/m.204719 type:complete len:241 (+) Transcript_72888:126-848(+)
MSAKVAAGRRPPAKPPLSSLLPALHAPLHYCDPVAQGERDALRSGSNPHAAGELAVGHPFDRDVGQCVLAENGLRVQIHRDEARGLDQLLDAHGLPQHLLHVLCCELALLLPLGRRGLLVAPPDDGHVGVLHDVLQEGTHLVDGSVDVDLVLPLELGPHRPEGQLADPRALDEVEDVHVQLVQDGHLLVSGALLLVGDVAEDDARLGARHLDRGVNHGLLAGRQRHGRRPVDQLEVALRA